MQGSSAYIIIDQYIYKALRKDMMAELHMFYWNELSKKVVDFQGIISHRISTSNGKMCPAPGFQIDRIPSLNK